MIDEADEKPLLAIARQALEARVAGGRAPDVLCIGPLALRCGAFVSIHNGDQLRGCLGRLSPSSQIGRASCRERAEITARALLAKRNFTRTGRRDSLIIRCL